jgi:hypothetical protein
VLGLRRNRRADLSDFQLSHYLALRLKQVALTLTLAVRAQCA